MYIKVVETNYKLCVQHFYSVVSFLYYAMQKKIMYLDNHDLSQRQMIHMELKRIIKCPKEVTCKASSSKNCLDLRCHSCWLTPK